MRILQINNCHYRRGGADVVYLNTGDLLEKKGHDVFYFSQKNENNYPAKSDRFFIESIDFFNRSLFQKINLIPRFFYSKEAAAKLKELIKECKPQIAHIHTYKGTLTPSILDVLKKAKIPIVISLHDYGFLCPHNSFIDGKGQVCTKCHTKNNSFYCILNKCNRGNLALSTISAFEFFIHKNLFPFSKYFDHLIGVSKFICNLHLENKSFKNKVTQLYNFYPDIEKLNPTYTKGDSFLFYGRLSSEKGVKTLLDAWLGLDKEIKLKIVGDGPLKSYVIDFIKKRKGKNIEYLGSKNKQEIDVLLSESSFIIVPSEWYENNPLTIVESFANGKPIIGADIGGIPEIVENNINGFIFRQGIIEDLRRCVNKAYNLKLDRYVEMSINARLFAEKNFSEVHHYENLMKIYNQLI